MKLIVPKEVLEKIEAKCESPGHRDHFLPKDLVVPLQDFIDQGLKEYDVKLYERYKYHRGTDERTLRYAWSSNGRKEDGAIKELRNLLCYFGFQRNWLDTVSLLKLDEDSIISTTKQTKHDYVSEVGSSKEQAIMMKNEMLDIEKVIKQYAEKLPLYTEFTNTLENFLEERMRDEAIADYMISSRTKGIQSFKEKIIRPGKNYSQPLLQLTDLSAARIIVCYSNQIKLVESILNAQFRVHKDDSVNKADELASNAFGYLSVHYVISINPEKEHEKRWKRFKQMKAEIQIRTILQNSWATVSHALQYKLESDIPRPLKRKLFRLASLFELADEQFMDIRAEHEKLNSEVSRKFDQGNRKISIDILSITQFLKKSTLMIEIINYAKLKDGFEIVEESFLKHDHSIITEECARLRIQTVKDLENSITEIRVDYREYLDKVSSLMNLQATKAFILFILLIRAFPSEFDENYLVKHHKWDVNIAYIVMKHANS